MAEKTASEYSFELADFAAPQLVSLLEIHHATVTDPESNVPGQKMYALNLRSLQSSDIQLWTVWTSDKTHLLGCAALKRLHLSEGPAGEVKSMHTVAAARGQGIGALLVAKLEVEAKKIGIKNLYLETGSQEGFSKARRFYEQQGFVKCGIFADYEEQENSYFMCKNLD